MPYASGIQVVNDANGTAHAFLADNGAIWQCQWDGQAQRWDQGQLVPLAFGGEKLQALYLDQLWPGAQASTASSGSQELNPGIVLAYRVGKGHSAEIYASFGQWDSSGELTWSAPIQLTNDQLDEQAFSIVPALGSAGGFSLVVQKRQAETPSSTLIDQLGQTSADVLAAKVEASLSGERPDSDLYTTPFSLAASASTPGWGVLNSAGSSFSAPITAAPAPSAIAASPIPLGGNTQLSRQQLPSNGSSQPTPTLLTTSSSEGGSGGVNDSQAGNYTGPVAGSWGKSGQWRAGMISGSNLTRWEIQIPLHHSVFKFKERNDIMSKPWKPRDPAAFVSIYDGTEANLEAGSSGKGQFRWEGTFGIRNIGAGLTSINTMKMSAGYGNDSEHRNSERSRLKADAKASDNDFTGYIGLGGMLVSQYMYQGSGGMAANLTLNPSQKLQQIITQESVGIDLLGRYRYLAPGGNSFKVTLSDFVGYMWSQEVTNNNDVPSWIADLGYYSGMVGNVEKMGKTIATVAGGVGGKINQWRGISDPEPNSLSDRAEGQENSGIGDQNKRSHYILNWINAAYGTALAVTTPVALQNIKGLNTENSSGIQNETELVMRALYHSVVGIELKVENKMEKYLKGAEKGSLEDKLYIAAGAALPLGGFLPLISYYHSFSSGSHTAETQADSNADGVYPSETTTEAATTSETVYNGSEPGSATPYTYTPSTANNI